MTEVIDSILSFLFEYRDDNRIQIYKKMKYGYRHYYLEFEADQNPNEKKSYFESHSLHVVLDNRNECVEFNNYVLEDKELLQKWSQILEEHLSQDLDKKIHELFEKKLSECFRKDIYREYQMRKLFSEGEDTQETK